LYTEKEEEFKNAIEKLMDYQIPLLEFPQEVKISEELAPEERPKNLEHNNPVSAAELEARGAAFHEKAEKNKKINQGGSYKREIAKKYKKPITRGDKNFAKKNKKRK
jgi:ATP-dependent RNA helicase RhlE